MIDNVTLWS